MENRFPFHRGVLSNDFKFTACVIEERKKNEKKNLKKIIIYYIFKIGKKKRLENKNSILFI